MDKNSIKIPSNIKQEQLDLFKSYYQIVKINDKNLNKLNPQSLANCLANVFELNLSNNPIKNEIAFIPRGENLTVLIQEDGWLTLLERTELVTDFQREEITTNHQYNYDTSKWEINPSLMFERENVKVIGYYCFIQIKNVLNKPINYYHAMTLQEVEKHRDMYGKTYNKDTKKYTINPIWISQFKQMALKTVVKACIKNIWKSPNILTKDKALITRALQIDQAEIIDHETIEYSNNSLSKQGKVKLHPINENLNNMKIENNKIENNKIENISCETSKEELSEADILKKFNELNLKAL